MGPPAPNPLGTETNYIRAVAISPDNHWLVTGSNEDGTVQLWNLRAKDPAASAIVLPGYEHWIVRGDFSPDSRWLVTLSKGSTAQLWRVQVNDLIEFARIVDCPPDPPA